MPTVSVIIPTYGHRDYVRATLDSVFAQTYTDYEVIVINDGSPDDTAEVLRPLVDAGRIRYIEQPNAGQSVTRNRGLALSTGTFIAYLDDDDLWPTDKLAWQVEVMCTSDAIAVSGNCRIYDNGTLSGANTTGETESLRPVDLFGTNPVFSPGQVLIRRTALVEAGGLDSMIWGTDDWDLWMRLAARGDFVFVHRVALHYRKHAGNASRAWKRMIENGRKVIAKNLPLLEPGQRTAAAEAGEQFLYYCYGCQHVQEVWSFRPQQWLKAMQAIGLFAGTAVRDRAITYAIMRDLAPVRLRRLIRPKR